MKDKFGMWGLTLTPDYVYLAYINAVIPFQGTWSGIRALKRGPFPLPCRGGLVMTEPSLIELLRQTPESERGALLDRECAGQPELRQRIEEALRNAAPIDDGTGQFTPKIEQSITGDFQSREDVEGVVIAGKYTLLEKIGEGGMGEVWVAKQTVPVKRKVALKLIKAGMDSKSVIQRFEQERQALAMMDHPNIAKVLDGGLTEDRRPFFVMELVNGLPLTKFCDEAKLSIRERLDLFHPICQAVQHAHQKGIIHRDLKPANILVTIIDGRPVPKVIDFGVAKATGGKITDDTMSTQFGAVVGTLEYMSPEQAGFSGVDIDTRSDIYSLGVILYELVTGLRPLDKSQLKQAAFDEMIRIIRETEPSKPSTRLSTDASLPSLAALRGTDPSRLTKLLRGELDWIIMKCLEKQRDRRYETVNALNRDVQRFLADEVVEARPPSVGYLLKKFIRRNKGRVIAAGLLLVMLVTGIIVTTLAMLEAQRAKQAETEQRQFAEQQKAEADDARNKALEEQRVAEKARDDEQKAREVTGEQRKLALDTVRDVLLRVDDLMKNDAKLAALRIEIIRRMLEDVDRIRDHAEKNPLADRTEAIAFSRIGEIYFKSGRIQDSVTWYKKSHVILDGLAKANPNDANALRNLAAINKQFAEAEWRIGNGNQSRKLLADVLDLYQRRLRLLEDSKKSADEIELASTKMDIAETYAMVAYADLRLGEPASALRYYNLSELSFATLPPPLNSFVKTRRIRNENLVRMGDAEARLENLAKAEAHFRKAIEERENLLKVITRPASMVSVIKTDVGQSQMYLGDFLYMFKKDKAKGAIEYERCLATFAPLLKVEPDSLDLQQRVAAAQYRLGCVAEPTKAKVAFEECLKLRESLARIDPTDMQTQVEYLLVLARLGQRQDAIRLADRLLDKAGKDRQVLFQVACGFAILGEGKSDEATIARNRAFNVLDDLIRNGWKDPIAIRTDPDLYPIHTDPRFADFLNGKLPAVMP